MGFAERWPFAKATSQLQKQMVCRYRCNRQILTVQLVIAADLARGKLVHEM
jgi:hypothetical protein